MNRFLNGSHRFGKKCGFNFKEHLDDRVGVLRAFVKKNKHVLHVEKTKKDEFGK